MKDIVLRMTQALVDDPDTVEVTETTDERGVLLNVRIPESQMGRVIGKGGKTAQAMRSIVKAIGLKTGEHVWIDIDVQQE